MIIADVLKFLDLEKQDRFYVMEQFITRFKIDNECFDAESFRRAVLTTQELKERACQ
jgi:hypothetical protein